MRYIFLVALLSAVVSSSAQMIDNTAIYRNTGAKRYLRLHYENDYFSTTDKYYTQGINLEFVHPVLKKLPIVKLLVHPVTNINKYGISAEHLGYTPTSISSPEILKGDRPFASCLMLKAFAISQDSVHQNRISSVISAGVIGPGAGGAEFQSAIHRWIDDTKPVGWKNQIQNDLILNYELAYEKSFLTYKSNILLTGKSGLRAGTLSNKISTGLALMAGTFDNPFHFLSESKNNFQIYIYTEPQINLVGYDATLQGGLFNRDSPYKISSTNLTRIVFQNNAGLVVKVKRFSIEYFQSFITKEFSTGKNHQWGGIRFGFSFK